MAVFTREKLSASTNGKGILVGAVATAGTTIHTAIAGTAGWDEIYAWASNLSTSPVSITVEFGGTTNPDNLLVKSLQLPPNSPPVPIITGQMLQNSLVVGVFASVTNVVSITGHVNRIS